MYAPESLLCSSTLRRNKYKVHLYRRSCRLVHVPLGSLFPCMLTTGLHHTRRPAHTYTRTHAHTRTRCRGKKRRRNQREERKWTSVRVFDSEDGGCRRVSPLELRPPQSDETGMNGAASPLCVCVCVCVRECQCLYGAQPEVRGPPEASHHEGWSEDFNYWENFLFLHVPSLVL